MREREWEYVFEKLGMTVNGLKKKCWEALRMI